MIEKCKELYKKYEEIINYLIVGVLTTIVSWTVKVVCEITILDSSVPWKNMLLSLISWAAGVTFSYFTSRKFVFKSKASNMLKEASIFVLSRVSTLLLDMLVMYVMVNVLTIDFIISTLVSAVLVTIANYILSKFIVFRKKQA